MMSADLVIVEAKVMTLDEDMPTAEAVAVKDGRIVYVGSNYGAERYVGGGTAVIRADGRTVLPGFIDAHIHPVSYGLSLMRLNLKGCRSIAEMKALVRAKAGSLQAPWVLGGGWDQELFDEKRYPTRWDLDEASTDRPVFLTRICGHVAVANTKALELAGITKETPDPEGGGIDRLREGGEPTGVLKENAMELVRRAIPEPTVEECMAAAGLAFSEALRLGLTCLHAVAARPVEIMAFHELRRRGLLPVRLRIYVDYRHLGAMDKLWILREPRDEFLRINGVKIFADGSLGARTAALREPYADDGGNYGVLTYSEDGLNEAISKAHELGLQVAVHAIGDRAIEAALRAIGHALNRRPRPDHRHRIEHASVLSDDLIDEMRRLNVVAVVQPSFIISDFWAVARVGKDRARWVYPFATLIRRGVRVCAGSDCPVEPMSPMYQVYSAVTRGMIEHIELYEYTSDESLTLIEALKLLTTNSAYAGFDEEPLGSIKAGKAADIVILSDDITSVKPEDLPKISAEATIVNGRIKFMREGGGLSVVRKG